MAVLRGLLKQRPQIRQLGIGSVTGIGFAGYGYLVPTMLLTLSGLRRHGGSVCAFEQHHERRVLKTALCSEVLAPSVAHQTDHEE
jgi:hypothetical protein